MDKKTYLEKIINKFEDWWINDPHSSNMDFYKNTLQFLDLTSLSNRDFVGFFYEFVSEGGRVQSGGYRTKNKFRDIVLKDFDFEGEAGASPLGYVNCQVCMFPMLKLIPGHINLTSVSLTQ